MCVGFLRIASKRLLICHVLVVVMLSHFLIHNLKKTFFNRYSKKKPVQDSSEVLRRFLIDI